MNRKTADISVCNMKKKELAAARTKFHSSPRPSSLGRITSAKKHVFHTFTRFPDYFYSKLLQDYRQSASFPGGIRGISPALFRCLSLLEMGPHNILILSSLAHTPPSHPPTPPPPCLTPPQHHQCYKLSEICVILGKVTSSLLGDHVTSS